MKPPENETDIGRALHELFMASLYVQDNEWVDACDRAGVVRPCDKAKAALLLAGYTDSVPEEDGRPYIGRTVCYRGRQDMIGTIVAIHPEIDIRLPDGSTINHCPEGQWQPVDSSKLESPPR